MRGMQISLDHPLLSRIVDDLATRGWSQHDLFLPAPLTRALAAECRRRAAEGELALRAWLAPAAGEAACNEAPTALPAGGSCRP